MKWIFLGVLLFGSMGLAAQYTPAYLKLTTEAELLYEKQDYQKSAMTYGQAFAQSDGQVRTYDRYNAACSWSRAGRADSAFNLLFTIAASGSGYYYEHMQKDKDLEPLRSDKRWKDLVAQIKVNKEKEEAKLDKQLVAELEHIFQEDQKSRAQLFSADRKVDPNSPEGKQLVQAMKTADSINLSKVTALLDKYGWLGPDVVGQKGATTLFLVIQHAPLEVQLRYLPLMQEAVKNRKAAGANLALLEDRVNLGTGKRQVYGTQVGPGVDGTYVVLPLEDPERVDERRQSVGLGPISDYLKRFNIEWDVKAYLKNLPEIEKNFLHRSTELRRF